MTIRAALINALGTMTEKEALDVVLALGQWADNQRNYIDDSDPQEVEAAERTKLAAAEAFVEAGEVALTGLVDRTPAPLPNPDACVTL